MIICSASRPESLSLTLEALAAAERGSLHVEAVVVNNGGREDIRAAADGCADRIPVRHLVAMTPGKCHALNRALDAGGLGGIVASLDDDMTPRRDWITAVTSACERWPGHDIFAGRGRIEWPPGPVPGWARSPVIRGWAYSLLQSGPDDEDAPLPPGHYPSGNHFWLRSRVLEHGLRFPDLWATEADLALQLAALGHRGVVVADAVAVHRIQPELLDPAVIRARAVRFGRTRAYLELRYGAHTRQVALYRRNRLAARGLWLARLARSCLAYAASYRPAAADVRFVRRLDALGSVVMNWEKVTRARELCDGPHA